MLRRELMGLETWQLMACGWREEESQHGSGSGCGAQESREGWSCSPLSVWSVDDGEDMEGAT